MSGDAPPTTHQLPTEALVSNVNEMRSPTWTTERSWGPLAPVTEAVASIRYLFQGFVRYRGNKIASDVIDAAVVLLARDGDEIATSDLDDLSILAEASGRHWELIPV